jgi:hypothetical protein
LPAKPTPEIVFATGPISRDWFGVLKINPRDYRLLMRREPLTETYADELAAKAFRR